MRAVSDQKCKTKYLNRSNIPTLTNTSRCFGRILIDNWTFTYTGGYLVRIDFISLHPLSSRREVYSLSHCQVSLPSRMSHRQHSDEQGLDILLNLEDPLTLSQLPPHTPLPSSKRTCIDYCHATSKDLILSRPHQSGSDSLNLPLGRAPRLIGLA